MTLALKTIQRVGNSTGIVLPPEVLRAAGLHRGDAVTVRVERGAIVISPVEALRPEVMEAGERVIARYSEVFRKLAE